MKDPFPSRRRTPNQHHHHPKKVNLLCTFNATFHPSGDNLRHTAGETRIVSVDRHIAFSTLKSHLLSIFPNTDPHCNFSLKYKLAVDDADEAPLVLITGDDDVRGMIDDYDEMGKFARLWIFVGCVEKVDSIDGFSSEMRKDDQNWISSGVLGLGFEGNEMGFDRTMLGLASEQHSLRPIKEKPSDSVMRNHMFSDQNWSSNGVLGLGFGGNEMGFDRTMLGLASDGVLGLGFEENEMGFTRETDRTMLGLASEEHNLKFEEPMKEKPSDSNISNTHLHLQESDNIGVINPGVGGFSPFVGTVNFQKQPFESTSKCLMHKRYELSSVHVPRFGNSDRENISPCSCSCSSVRSRVVSPSCSNQHWRSCLYYIRRHRNSLLSEVGTQRNVKVDGRPWVGKFYPGIRSSSDISKQGQAMRLYYPSLLKPSPSAGLHSARFGLDSFAPKGGHRVPKPLLPNLNKCHIAHYNDPCSPLNKNTSTCSTSEKHVICVHEVKPMCDLKMAQNGAKRTEAFPKDCGFTNGTELQCFDSPVESNGHADFVNLSVHNLSLSSPKEDESPAGSPPTGNLIDNEHLCSGSQVEIQNGIASNSSHNKDVTVKADDQNSEIQPEKVKVIESHKSFKENGVIPSGLAAVYTHLASRELQTIKSSDLEYIKELGSGTYGTVFYGKWKGCDVAIKKLKPSCFTEGGTSQDRLVADFWKEAHILGGLHHPHIVALYGVVRDGPATNLATVTEYMVNGSLKQVLRRKDRTIDRRKRMIIAMDAAFGMEYLHEKNIVHFDLKSHNLLVNMRDPQRPLCKIGDLGLSKIKRRTMVSGGVRGTIPWMAPELLNCTKSMVTEKVDVYSFGIVMWELLTGEEPYADMRSEEIIAGIIKGDLRPEVPNWCDPAWRSLMEKCWCSDPESRPSFTEISKELRCMSASMNIK